MILVYLNYYITRKRGKAVLKPGKICILNLRLCNKKKLIPILLMITSAPVLKKILFLPESKNELMWLVEFIWEAFDGLMWKKFVIAIYPVLRIRDYYIITWRKYFWWSSTSGYN